MMYGDGQRQAVSICECMIENDCSEHICKIAIYIYVFSVHCDEGFSSRKTVQFIIMSDKIQYALSASVCTYPAMIVLDVSVRILIYSITFNTINLYIWYDIQRDPPIWQIVMSLYDQLAEYGKSQNDHLAEKPTRRIRRSLNAKTAELPTREIANSQNISTLTMRQLAAKTWNQFWVSKYRDFKFKFIFKQMF